MWLVHFPDGVLNFQSGKWQITWTIFPSQILCFGHLLLNLWVFNICSLGWKLKTTSLLEIKVCFFSLRGPTQTHTLLKSLSTNGTFHAYCDFSHQLAFSSCHWKEVYHDYIFLLCLPITLFKRLKRCRKITCEKKVSQVLHLRLKIWHAKFSWDPKRDRTW